VFLLIKGLGVVILVLINPYHEQLDPLSEAPSSENLSLARPSTSNVNVIPITGEVHAVPEENATDTLLHAAERSILALPSPIEILGPEQGSWRAWMSWAAWSRYARCTVLGDGAKNTKKKGKKDGRRVNEKKVSRRAFYRRSARTGLLVMKLFTIVPGASWWDDSESFYGRQLDPWIIRILVLAAMLDGVVYHDDSDLGSRANIGSSEKDSSSEVLPRPLFYPMLTHVRRFHRDVWITLVLALVHALILGAFNHPDFNLYFLSMTVAMGVIMFS